MLGISGSFGASGIKKYANVEELPISNVKVGTLAHVETNLKNRSALYIFNRDENGNAGWYKIATVNLAPVIVQGPDAAYNLSNDGSPLTIELVAEDPEGLPITWTATGSTSGLADIVQDGNTFTISASQSAVTNETSGSFELVFKATDGVSFSAAASTFSLQFAIGPADPTNLIFASRMETDSEFLRQVYIAENGHACIVHSENNANLNTPRVSVYDISDIDNPILKGYVENPGSEGSVVGVYGCISGNILMINNVSVDTIYFVDVSDPENPFFVRTVNGWRTANFCNKNFVIVSNQAGQLATLDVTTGQLVDIISQTDGATYLDGNIRHGRCPDDYDGNVFVIGQTGSASPPSNRSMRSLSLNESGFISIETSFFKDQDVNGCYFFDGRFAYTKTFDTDLVQIWDIQDPKNPFKVFEESTVQSGNRSGTISMFVQDGFLYVSHSSTAGSDLHLYDVSEPSQTQYIGITRSSSVQFASLSAINVSNQAVLFGDRETSVSKRSVILLKDS